MSFTHVINRTWSSPTGVALSAPVSLTDGGEANLDLDVGIGATDIEIPIAFDSARVKSVYILASQDLTIETNSSSAPDDTLSPKANKPLTWVTGDPGTAMFTADVTKFFITNGSGVLATLKVRILHDPTA